MPDDVRRRDDFEDYRRWNEASGRGDDDHRYGGSTYDRDRDRNSGYGNGGQSTGPNRDRTEYRGDQANRSGYGRSYGSGDYGARSEYRRDFGRGQSSYGSGGTGNYGAANYGSGNYGSGDYGRNDYRSDSNRSDYGRGDYRSDDYRLSGGYRNAGSDEYGYGPARYYDPSGGYGNAGAGYRSDYNRGNTWRDDRPYRGEDRGWFDRASDEVASWFGDEDADRRRNMDAARDGEHRGRGPRNYSRSDDRIREDVSDRLTDDSYIDAGEIEVTVRGSEVTLSGTVDNRVTKRRAEDLAERVSGVTHVQNNLRVRQQTGQTGSSSWSAGSTGGTVGGSTSGTAGNTTGSSNTTSGTNTGLTGKTRTTA